MSEYIETNALSFKDIAFYDWIKFDLKFLDIWMYRRPRTGTCWTATILFLAGLPLIALGEGGAPGFGEEESLWPEDDECLICHGRTKLKREESEESVFIDQKILRASIHSKLACVHCHIDLREKDLPHEKKLARPACGSCHYHEEIEKLHRASIHGQLLSDGDKKAPHCQDCHGGHDITPARDPRSVLAKSRIAPLCKKCHQDRSERFHESSLEKGLLVAASCVSCHTAHQTLPRTSENSAIARGNADKTCLKCHVQFEEAHQKVIARDLWEEAAEALPACIDCHHPHEFQGSRQDGVPAENCLQCHGTIDLETVDGRSLFVDAGELSRSRHAGIACSQCHWGSKPAEDRPCATITRKVRCAACHAGIGKDHQESRHGELLAQNDPHAPSCQDCHGSHGILGADDSSSPIHPLRVPILCSRCHRDPQPGEEGAPAARRREDGVQDAVSWYSESIHGRGLLEGGLLVSATCTSCHTAHQVLPGTDLRSSVHPENLPATCGKCHLGIQETFLQSVHSSKITQVDRELPTCGHCHDAHFIGSTDDDGFRLEIMTTCGRCHPEVARTYFYTYHGKVSLLGYARTAKCHDCHGAHDILPAPDHRSHLNKSKIVATCKKCHSGATRNFAGFLPHADPRDPERYPGLFAVFVGMTALLVGTFSVFGLHILLWLPRSAQLRRRYPRMPPHAGEKRYVRFSRLDRLLHILMILSFLFLGLTGLTLKFSHTGWASFLSSLLGGFQSAGTIHRVAALLMIGVFAAHLADVLRKKRRNGFSWREMLSGPNTLLPVRKDSSDFWGTIKWFLGRGERPRYGRWSYWEKFDYLAAFWGIVVIGSTGLLLWFSELFTRFLPGSILNVATIIHSDEALLAVGFIFTIHFFNTHLRPEKFPMDVSIFTGQLSLEEFRRDKPLDYEALEKSGELERRLADPLSPGAVQIARIFAWAALAMGFFMVVWIVYAMLFAEW